MLIDILREFILELLRALFLEVLCQRVKDKLVERARRRRVWRHQALLRRFHVRQRKNLIHKLTTGAEGDL